jgi:hypothetical protein
MIIKRQLQVPGVKDESDVLSSSTSKNDAGKPFGTESQLSRTLLKPTLEMIVITHETL